MPQDPTDIASLKNVGGMKVLGQASPYMTPSGGITSGPNQNMSVIPKKVTPMAPITPQSSGIPGTGIPSSTMNFNENIPQTLIDKTRSDTAQETTPEAFKQMIVTAHPDGVANDGRKYADISSYELTKMVTDKYPDAATNAGVPYKDYLVAPRNKEEDMIAKGAYKYENTPGRQILNNSIDAFHTGSEEYSAKSNDLINGIKTSNGGVIPISISPNKDLANADNYKLASTLIGASKFLGTALEGVLNAISNPNTVGAGTEGKNDINYAFKKLDEALSYAPDKTAKFIQNNLSADQQHGLKNMLVDMVHISGLDKENLASQASVGNGVLELSKWLPLLEGPKVIGDIKGSIKEGLNFKAPPGESISPNYISDIKPRGVSKADWKAHQNSLGKDEIGKPLFDARNQKAINQNIETLDAVRNGVTNAKIEAQADAKGFNPKLDVATYHELQPDVNSDGRIDSGTALDNLDSHVTPLAKDVRSLIEKEGKRVSIDELQKNIQDEMGSNKADIVNGPRWEEVIIKAIERARKEYGDENGTIALEHIDDIKKKMYDNSNYLNPDDTAMKAIGRGARTTIEDAFKSIDNPKYTDIKALNNELARWYVTRDYLKSIDGHVVKGGRAGKYFSTLAGKGVGFALGSVFGPLGEIATSYLGGEAASFIHGKMLEGVIKKTTAEMPGSSLFDQAKATLNEAPKQIGGPTGEPIDSQNTYRFPKVQKEIGTDTQGFAGSNNTEGKVLVNPSPAEMKAHIALGETMMKVNEALKSGDIGKAIKEIDSGKIPQSEIDKNPQLQRLQAIDNFVKDVDSKVEDLGVLHPLEAEQIAKDINASELNPQEKKYMFEELPTEVKSAAQKQNRIAEYGKDYTETGKPADTLKESILKDNKTKEPLSLTEKTPGMLPTQEPNFKPKIATQKSIESTFKSVENPPPCVSYLLNDVPEGVKIVKYDRGTYGLTLEDAANDYIYNKNKGNHIALDGFDHARGFDKDGKVYEKFGDNDTKDGNYYTEKEIVNYIKSRD